MATALIDGFEFDLPWRKPIKRNEKHGGEPVEALGMTPREGRLSHIDADEEVILYLGDRLTSPPPFETA